MAQAHNVLVPILTCNCGNDHDEVLSWTLLRFLQTFRAYLEESDVAELRQGGLKDGKEGPASAPALCHQPPLGITVDAASASSKPLIFSWGVWKKMEVTVRLSIQTPTRPRMASATT